MKRSAIAMTAAMLSALAALSFLTQTQAQEQSETQTESRPTATAGEDDLGQIGPIYPIAETDLLDSLLAAARHKQEDGEAAELAEKLHRRAEAYADAPPSLHLPRAAEDTTRPFDPTLTMPEDIKDAQGNVIVAAGTRVNPLKTLAFNETLLFVDGDDPEQVAWLKQHLDPNPAALSKIVLTGGSPSKVSEQLGRRVYFDQKRQLTSKFGIDAVPATVASDPNAPRARLLVREYDPAETLP